MLKRTNERTRRERVDVREPLRGHDRPPFVSACRPSILPLLLSLFHRAPWPTQRDTGLKHFECHRQLTDEYGFLPAVFYTTQRTRARETHERAFTNPLSVVLRTYRDALCIEIVVVHNFK